MKFDVIGLDSPCVDLAVNVRCFPKPNGAERIQNLSWQGGGKVASGMVAAARLGLCCGIMGNVGDDKYGTFCLRDFQDHGIDTEQMCVRKNRTKAFVDSVPDCDLKDQLSIYRTEVNTKVQQLVDEMLIGKSTPEETQEKLIKEINAILAN